MPLSYSHSRFAASLVRTSARSKNIVWCKIPIRAVVSPGAYAVAPWVFAVFFLVSVCNVVCCYAPRGKESPEFRVCHAFAFLLKRSPTLQPFGMAITLMRQSHPDP